ncbi:MAG: DUF4173 domain-containing protein [Oscillospiraceae bacterium]|nr:DUF4173 domain-containing protein [Oscillospiraceae bacterium]
MNCTETVPQGNDAIAVSAARSSVSSFSSTKTERICSLLSYILAFAYTGIYYNSDIHDPSYIRTSVCIALTAALIILITELIHRGVSHDWESWIWLSCFCATVLSAVFRRNSVWEPYQVLLFIHIFAVWWVISRAGILLEGKSGHLLPLDAVNGFIAVPFGNFFLRIRTVFDALTSRIAGKREKKRHFSIWTAAALIVSALLFLKSADLLLNADSGFEARFSDISESVRRFLSSLSDMIDETLPERILFSIPVGAWLFGLTAGSRRYSRTSLERERRAVSDILSRLRRVPSVIWAAVISLFSLMYLAFFILQSSYLFGAFTGTLPEGFIVYQYAREGFFELCKVITVNFTLLWFVTRMTSDDSRNRLLFLIPCLILLAESIIFAVIAFSKLFLYIRCFGFTPLRLQSTWLVCLCFAGCVLWIYSLLTGKPAFRKWMIFGAVTLSALCLL